MSLSSDARTEEARGSEPARRRDLPSGRSVVLKVTGAGEELEVRSPAGEVEVRIQLTDAGPIVSLRGGRLELESPDTVAVQCRRFEVQSEEEVLLTGQELRVRTKGDIHLNGDVIRLNC